MPPGPKVAGVAVVARDTGRALMLQRAYDADDPAAGTWEFAGGHVEPGDRTPLDGAWREWEEEIGRRRPRNHEVVGTWGNDDPYRGYIVVVPRETDIDLSAPRVVDNPDDDSEQRAWWEIRHARKFAGIRPELARSAPWQRLATAGRAAVQLTRESQDWGRYEQPVELLRRGRWREKDHPRDRKGRFTDHHGNDLANLALTKEHKQGFVAGAGQQQVRIGHALGDLPGWGASPRKLGALTAGGKHALVGKKGKRVAVVTNQVEDANLAEIPGEVSRKELTGGNSSQRVDRVKLKDGSEVVHKVGDVPTTQGERKFADLSDELGFGAEVPRVEVIGRNQTKMPFLPHKPAMEQGHGLILESDKPKDLAILRTQEGRNIGAADFLAGNHDRHNANVLLGEDGKPYAIDQGLAFRQDTHNAMMRWGMYESDDPTTMGQPFSAQLLKDMKAGEDVGFNPHDWTPKIKKMQSKLEPAEYEALQFRHAILNRAYDQGRGGQ